MPNALRGPKVGLRSASLPPAVQRRLGLAAEEREKCVRFLGFFASIWALEEAPQTGSGG